MFRMSVGLVLLAMTAASAAFGASKKPYVSPQTSEAAITRATPSEAKESAPALIISTETLLDRAHFSPGEIDGEDGDNYRRALRAFQQANNLRETAKLDMPTWNALTSNGSSESALKHYTMSAEDVAGPFDKTITANLDDMARLPGLPYTTPRAELAEKFHMSERLLSKLNPRADFSQVGADIVVANVSPMPLRSGDHTVEVTLPNPSKVEEPRVQTIVVDKPARDVRAYDKNGKLLAFYPATIGSEEKPAPTGVFKVKRVAFNPEFVYDPKFAWKGVKAQQKLTVKPGPNNPVGLVWIDLSAPSYGIHGTPQPDAIGKTESHGCVRLTNWDAVALASMVRPGTTVRFEDHDLPVVAPTPPSSASEEPPSEVSRQN
jgi:lipoprotein-anchoring transpeptidase ErfK/SrfK